MMTWEPAATAKEAKGEGMNKETQYAHNVAVIP